jgi:hypothetical protein
MILNPEKLIQLFDSKYVSYSNNVLSKFNSLNSAPMLDVSLRVIHLHQLLSSGAEFDKEYFTPEEYESRELVKADEESRIEKVASGEYTPYYAEDEDLKLLTISLEEIKQCGFTEEELDAVTTQLQNDKTKV